MSKKRQLEPSVPETKKETKEQEEKDQLKWRFPQHIQQPKILRWPDVPEGKCGMCLKDIPKDQDKPADCVSRSYHGNIFTTSNPPFTDARVFRPFCYPCWSKYHTEAIVVDGYRRYMFNHFSVLHVVSNWQGRNDIKLQRNSGTVDQNCKLVTQYFDENEKQVTFMNFNTYLGEPMIYLWTADSGVWKPQYLSDIQKLNPHLPPFRFRFPNRVPFHTVLQWMNKPAYPRPKTMVDKLKILKEWVIENTQPREDDDDDEERPIMQENKGRELLNKLSDASFEEPEAGDGREMIKLFYLSEWYDPDVASPVIVSSPAIVHKTDVS